MRSDVWTGLTEAAKCDHLGIEVYPCKDSSCRERWKELVRSMPRERFCDAMAISRGKYYGWLADKHQSHYKMPTSRELQRACWTTGYNPAWVMFGIGPQFLSESVVETDLEKIDDMNTLINTLEFMRNKLQRLSTSLLQSANE